MSKINEQDQSIKFISNNKEIAMQKVTIIFPDSFKASNGEILFLEFSLPTTLLTTDLESYLTQRDFNINKKAVVIESTISLF